MDIDQKNLDFQYIMKHQKSLQLKLGDKEKVIEYDYKIVSFRIGHEYYGIDIMNVKEILKENKFTRVPNSLEFVKGVLNLRGEIIPIIDLSIMFHLNIEKPILDINEKSETEAVEEKNNKKDDISKKRNNLKSIIVVRVEKLLIGLIVEQIERVIPLSEADIQPPSPLLGSINERYIKGVAEINEKLFVIFDTDEIFSAKEKVKKDVLRQASDISEEIFVHFISQIEEISGIHINDYNKAKFRTIYMQFIEKNKIDGMSKITKNDSENILEEFYSKYTGRLWDQPYVDHFNNFVLNELKKICSDEIKILVVGCANGHEAFSLYFIFDKFFDEAKIKMVAADSNLAAVSNASGFEINKDKIPSWINKSQYFMKLDDENYKIKKEINNNIYFEFHDARNIGSFNREFDLVIARDLSLDLTENDYESFINDINKKIIKGGVLVIGDNENLVKSMDFSRINNKYITLYNKN